MCPNFERSKISLRMLNMSYMDTSAHYSIHNAYISIPGYMSR